MALSPALDAAPHLFWITSRAAGVVALLTASLAVSLGLLMSTSLTRQVSKSHLRVAHEALSLSAIVALVVHGASLLGDRFLHPSILDVAVPLVSPYRTLWTTIGIIGGWGLILLALSYYARHRIGVGRWRVLHRFTALAWILGLIHSLGEGTDAGQVWFLAMLAPVAVPALALLLWRTSRPQTRVRPAGIDLNSEPRGGAAGWREPLATPRRSR